MHETGRADPELVATARQFIAETREAATTNKIGLLNADIAEWALAIVQGDAALAARYYPRAAERLHGDRIGFAPMLLWPPRLARCAGLVDEAADGFRHALEHTNRQRRNYHLASVLYELGRALVEWGRGEDREEASGLFEEALGICDERGYAPLAEKIRGLLGGEGAGNSGDLTPREVEVLRLVAAGRTNREIGFELYISPKTVDTHVRNILRKTGCANRAEASAYAARRGIAGE